MKILHIITGLNTGGAEMMLYKLLSSIDRDKFSNYVVSLLDEGTIGAKIKDLDITIYSLNLKSLLSLPQALLKLVKIVNEINPDLIQGWMYHGNLAAQLVKILSFKSIPVLWNIRNSLNSSIYEKQSTNLIIRFSALISFLPENIVYNSQIAIIQHKNIGFDPDKNIFIPNGFDIDYFSPSQKKRMKIRQELNIKDNSILIGLIGRFHPMKDHDNFLQSASILSKNNHDKSIYFLCSGKNVDWNNLILIQKIKELNLTKKIFLLGEREDIDQINSALDIATNCSCEYEGFANVVGEAMACEVTCVVTDVGDSAYIVGDTGKVISPKNPEALAQAWQELIEMGKEERKVLGEKARQRVIDNFALDAIIQKYENLYQDVIDEQKY